MSDGGKSRDEYTWSDACRDLALATRLTLEEAVTVRLALESTGAHPYDAVPQLIALFGDGDVDAKARGLGALLNGQRAA